MNPAFRGWTPRRAAALLTLALRYVDPVVRPPTLREPVADILRAAVELCVSRTSLLGLPIGNALELARRIVVAAEGGDDEGG